MKTPLRHLFGAALAAGALAGCAGSRPAASPAPVARAAAAPKPAAAAPVKAASSAPARSRLPADDLLRYDSDVYVVRPEERERLRAHAEALRADPALRLVVRAHTDAVGASAYNQALAEKRADTVVKLIAAHGADRGQLVPVALGELEPAARGSGAEALAQNRRVELLYGDAAFARAQVQAVGALRLAQADASPPVRRVGGTKSRPAPPPRSEATVRMVSMQR